MEDFHISGMWTCSECRLHINTLELKAVILAFHHWFSVLRGHQVMIATENTTVVAYMYINKQGAIHSHTLLWLVVDLFLWLQTQGIATRARHILGCLNVKADRLSRPNQPITTEWSLESEIVNQIFGMWGTPAVDMFVTVHNTHLPQFVSSSGALSISDRCSVTRQAGEVDVLFPPFPLLSQVIQKLRTIQEGEVILIAPLVAITTMVSTSTTSVCVDHPTSFHTAETSCHNTDMQHYQAARFSKEVSRLAAAPKRQTECMTTGGFASLTGPQDRELIRLVPQLLKLPLLLYYLFDTHVLSPQTIKGYRSCLASVLNRTGKGASVQAKTSSDMITSMELQRPRTTLVLPQFDL